jgi:hypothetical protein
MIKWVGTLRVDMQKDLSKAARTRGPGRLSLAGGLAVLAVLLATLAVASYPRVAVGAAAGAAVTVLLRGWYTRVGAPDAPASRRASGSRSGAGSERTRTEQREARLANGQG